MSATLKPSTIAAILAVILFFAVNVIFLETLTGARADLTEDALYTISENTEQVLESLENPVQLTYFFSEDVARDYPQFFEHGRRIAEMLREYAAIAGDSLQLEIVNPEPFSEAEDRAVEVGLQSVPTATGEQIYMGLVARDMTDREEIIPLFSRDRQGLLEYDLTRMIWTVSRDEQPTVALLTALPMRPQPPNPMQRRPDEGWAIFGQLNEFFDVRELDPGFTEIPEGTDVLLIVHPPALEAGQLYAIDQYVMAGGRAAVFVDPYSEASASPAAAQLGAPRSGPDASNLEPLLSSWGVRLIEGKVAADLNLAERVNMGGGGPRAIKDFILWIGLGKEQLAGSDPVTANLDKVTLASSGVLEAVEGAATALEPLARTSEVSALLDVAEARGMPDPDTLLRRFEPDEGRHILLGRVTGPAQSAYPDGPPDTGGNGEADADGEDEDASGAAQEAVDDAAEPGDHLAEARGDIAVLVGADSDLFEDRFWVQTQNIFGQRIEVPIADNASLLINALEHLAGAEALLGLRGRGVTERPFEVVERMRRAAEQRYLAEEQRLQDELAATEQRLQELQSQMGQGARLITPEQEAEVERFRDRALEIREALRRVQRGLVEDIEALGRTLAFLNIGLVPVLLTVAAIAVGWYRRRMRARRWAT